MASVSASHLILFTASMIIAASVAGVFTEQVGRLSNAIEEQGLDVSRDVRTDIEIISDSGSDQIYNDEGNENITLYVKNTGSATLPAQAAEIDVLVNGTYTTAVTVTLLGGASSWHPGEVVRVEISVTLGSGDQRVKLIINGDEEVFEFRT